MHKETNTFTTDQGLTVIHTPRPTSGSISFSLRVIAGSMFENNDEIGVAHFLEHIVLDGTKKYPSKKLLSGLIDERGGVRNASTNKERIEYTVKVLKDDAEIAFDFLSQIIIHPLIFEEDISKEKKIIEQEINRIKSDPEKYSERLIYSGLFPGTRLGMLNTGDIEDINKLTRDKIVGFHKKTHSAKNMVLSIVGDISEDEVNAFVKQYFNELEGGSKILPIEISSNISGRPTIVNMQGLKQTTLTLGYRSFPANTDESYALDIISKILMMGSTSRLRYEIREKMALAYALSGSNHRSRNYGIFTIHIGLDQNRVNECINAIKGEFDKIKNELISQEELNKAYTFIKSGQIFGFENSLTLASFYSDLWSTEEVSISVEDILAKYERIYNNPAYIQEVAKKVFSVEPVIQLIGSNIPPDIAFL